MTAQNDRLDRAVGWWAEQIGFADPGDEEDVRFYADWIRGASRATKIPRVLIAAAWAGTAGAMSVVVPVAIHLLRVRYPDAPAWSFLDIDAEKPKDSKTASKEKGARR
jgi:hypothetical protein